MAWTTAAAIYFLIWWVVLFAVLPFGIRNPAEEGVTVEAGHDPGAPTALGMRKKLIWTTAITTVLFAVFWVVYTYRLVSLKDLATLWGMLR
jgi:predicted secreted protein